MNRFLKIKNLLRFSDNYFFESVLDVVLSLLNGIQDWFCDVGGWVGSR